MNTDSNTPTGKREKPERLANLAVRITHRIRDELAIISDATALLVNDKTIPEEPRGKLAAVKDRLDYAAALASQFLGLAGHRQQQRSAVDVRAILDKMAPLLRRLLDESHVLTIEADPRVWLVTADIEQIELIVIRLTVNARDAMPDGGQLKIRASNVSRQSGERRGDYVMIEFSDTGVGVSKDGLNRMFEPFPSQTCPRASFDLACSFRSIKELGGHMVATSQAGGGVCVRVLLPWRADV